MTNFFRSAFCMWAAILCTVALVEAPVLHAVTFS